MSSIHLPTYEEQDDPDLFASTVNYTITVITNNRQLTLAERAAIRQAVQGALDLLTIQCKVIDNQNIIVRCIKHSSSSGHEDIKPTQELSHEN